MDQTNRGVDFDAIEEEKIEDVNEILNENQYNDVNRGNTKDEEAHRTQPTTEHDRSSEQVIVNAKENATDGPLSAATLKKDLQKLEDGITTENTLEPELCQSKIKYPSCTSPHEGRQLVNVNLNLHIDQVFNMLFSESDFYFDFHSERKTTDIVHTQWEEDADTGGKKKTVELTVSLNKSVGPKTTRVTENLVMLPCSQPGKLYSMDLCAYNSGIPYSDAFHCFNHYCLYDTTQDYDTKENNMNAGNLEQNVHQIEEIHNPPSNFTCHFSAYSQLVFTKSLWSPVKAIIEKSSWPSLEEFYDSLIAKLKDECDRINKSAQNELDADRWSSIIRKRKQGITDPGIAETVKENIDHPLKSRKSSKGRKRKSKRFQDGISWTLLVITLTSFALLNVFLYYKLNALEEIATKTDTPVSKTDFDTLRFNPEGYKEWLALPIHRGSFNNAEMEIWRNTLDKVTDLLQEAEDLMESLTKKIPLEARHRVMIANLQKTSESPRT